MFCVRYENVEAVVVVAFSSFSKLKTETTSHCFVCKSRARSIEENGGGHRICVLKYLKILRLSPRNNKPNRHTVDPLKSRERETTKKRAHTNTQNHTINKRIKETANAVYGLVKRPRLLICASVHTYQNRTITLYPFDDE